MIAIVARRLRAPHFRLAALAFEAALAVAAALAFEIVPRAHAGAGPATCGNVVSPPGITASDALAVLQSAVGLRECSVCACDADGNSNVTATDALFTLKKAVGQAVTLSCPSCCEHCKCTPQTIDLLLGEVTPCEGCIARVPLSNSTTDSITISFDGDLNGTWPVTNAGGCLWEGVIPAAIAEKAYYGSSNGTCSGSAGSSSADIDVVLRVERTADGWEIRVGQYAEELGWGDVLVASIANDECIKNDKAVNANEACHLAELGNTDDHDVHATGGYAAVLMPEEDEPACR